MRWLVILLVLLFKHAMLRYRLLFLSLAMLLAVDMPTGQISKAEAAADSSVLWESAIEPAGPLGSKEEALAWASKLPFVPVDADRIDAVPVEWPSGLAWNLMFIKNKKNGNGTRDSVFIRVTQNEGKLVSVSVSHQDEDQYGGGPARDGEVNRLSLEEGRPIARTFIDDLDWGLGALWVPNPYREPPVDIRYEDPTLCKVRFYQESEGIHYDSFDLFVDHDGKVVAYGLKWSVLELELPADMLWADEAAAAIYDQSQPYLIYENSGMEEPRLVYSMSTGELDAVTGEWLVPPRLLLEPSTRRVREDPLEPLRNDTEWTLEQMTQRITDALELPDGARMLDSNRSDGLYEFAVPSVDAAYSRTDFIQMNRQTGQFRSYRMQDEFYSVERELPFIGEEEAREAAYAFLEKAVPAYAHQLWEYNVYLPESGTWWGMIPQYKFWFYRMPGGIPVQGEKVELTVNAYSGAVDSLSTILSERPYPDEAAPTVSMEKAKRKLLSLYDLGLGYWISADESQVRVSYEMLLRPEVPMFFTGDAPRVDAYSGEWLNFLGEKEVVPEAVTWVDELMSSPRKLPYQAAIVLDGKLLDTDKEPQILNDVTMVPMRKLFESLGAEVSWDAETRTVLAVKGNIRLELHIGSPTMILNGESHPVTMPAQIVQDSTYVPARLVAEALGAQVDWDGESRLVIVRTSTDLPYPDADILKKLRLDAYLNWEEKYR
jgi:hypothetical protein